MNPFEKVSFRGSFRSYQQSIIDESSAYLDDGKINIVAAPGSGKTVLGLELIRKLGLNALVLSPTVTIKCQWGERFIDWFMPEGGNPSEYLSYDLRKPAPITSVTYQALYYALNRMKAVETVDDENETEGSLLDFSEFELIKKIKASDIKVICLDEAHHLRSEWQKALEAFLAALGKEVTTIALTATPPYDSGQHEWRRYLSVCGEIDCEIYVPELVQQKTLCPHQDYIYFNYPTAEEMQIVDEFRLRAAECVKTIIESGLFENILKTTGLLNPDDQKMEQLLDHPKEYAGILSAAQSRGIKVPKRVIKLICAKNQLPDFNVASAETVFGFMLDNPAFFSPSDVEWLKTTLIQYRLLLKDKVRMTVNEEVGKILITSAGKMDSIAVIAKEEYAALGRELRMVVLTDYIRKDMLGIVGTDAKLETMGTVPVFESIRRAVGQSANIALLSGTLVIWPSPLEAKLAEVAKQKNVAFSARPLAGTAYSEIKFIGSNQNKISVITEAFRQGMVEIIVGTKALLGEGWDSPCINSLVLASFIGSFVLSNQMRGRAMRTVSGNPSKTANIWHLVTIEPTLTTDKSGDVKRLSRPSLSDHQKIMSEDYETLKRRFDCFFAPAYHSEVITSGIERLDIIRPPYHKKGIERINHEMLALAKDRQGMSKKWSAVLSGTAHPEILDVREVPKAFMSSGFLFFNFLNLFTYGTLFFVFLRIVIGGLTGAMASLAPLELLLSAALAILMGVFLWKWIKKTLHNLSPAATIKTFGTCVLQTLWEMGEIKTRDVSVKVEAEPLFKQSLLCSLTGGTAHEKSLFSTAMGELLSPIDNPRYVIIKQERIVKRKANYRDSYACPSIFGTKKEYAEAFSRCLGTKSNEYFVHYTRSPAGHTMLNRCRRKSYINRNEIEIKRMLMQNR